MKNKKVTVKKLYEGFASIRSYIVEKCIIESRGITIHYKNFIMSLNGDEVKEKFVKLHELEFDSKYSNTKYKLIDIKFKPDSLGS